MTKFAFGAKPKAPMKEFTRLVEEGEVLGFDAAWVPDQTFFPDPFVSIAMSASTTRHIEMVVGVVNPYTRHPAQVARSLGTLDDIAPGRVALGYGAGNRRELIVPLGREQDRPVARCREAIWLCRQLLRGEMVHYRSDTLVAEGVQLEMAPHPDIPIYLAGRGPHMLQLAGEIADTAVIGALWSEEGLAFAIEQVRIGAARAGRELNEVGLMSWITCYVTNDKARWLEFYRPSAAHILAGAPHQVFEALKLTQSFMTELKATYAQGGSTAAARLVPDEVALQLAAIGSAEEVADQIRRAEQAGIDQVGLLVNAPTLDGSLGFLRRFGRQVIPLLGS